MSTLKQIINNGRIKKIYKNNSQKLKKNPQKKGLCLKILTISPKKPNSANRRISKAVLIQSKVKLAVKIPGENHNLQQHSNILIHGARVRDLIGISYKAIRGKYDLEGVLNRKTSRSRFGVKKIK